LIIKNQVAAALSDMRVRPATLSDLPLICVIENQSFKAPYPKSLLERLLKDCSESFFAAVDAEAGVVGYCVLSLRRSSAHVISIAVHPRFRRIGVASALLKAAIDYLTSHNVSQLRLEVGVENVEAVSLYNKFGFERTNVVKDYYSDGSDAVIMHLFLRGAAPEKHLEVSLFPP
jgi:ribosomal-protein-alanine N-acetyltransferase